MAEEPSQRPTGQHGLAARHLAKVSLATKRADSAPEAESREVLATGLRPKWGCPDHGGDKVGVKVGHFEKH